jgi:rhodanese-related sulfurtransferase/DNA-binding transcriptional ArsR family regulator
MESLNSGVKHREFKDRVYSELARISQAVASPHRLELVDLLAQGERSVELLAREAGLSVANASRHLQVLRGARLVESRKQGLHVYYRLAACEVFALSRAVRALAERRLAELDRLVRGHLAWRDELEAVTRGELLRRVREGRAAVVDVRPVEEYRAGHIPGALSLPLAQLERRLAELPRSKEIVAYCRGPHCVMAWDAVARLRARGFRARRLVEGLPEWRAAGLPVEASAA